MEGNQADPMDGRIEGIRIEGPADFTSDEFNETTREGCLTIYARDGIGFGETRRYTDDKPRRIANCYVFCCSCEYDSPTDDKRAKHFEATTAAFINDPAAFAVHVGLYLRNARDQNGRVVDAAKIGYNYSYAPVRYLSRTKPNVHEVNNLDLFVFQKDPAFRFEQEFRFCWVLYDKSTGEQVYVHPEAVFVPLPPGHIYETGYTI